jgi:Leucine-rich repeat (LRR) protein
MNLKRFITAISCLFSFVSVFSQNIEFQDKNLEQAILNHEPAIDTNNDGLIQKEEALDVTEIRAMNKGIASIEDIYHFPNIKKLVVTNNHIANVKLIGLDSLQEFYCAANNLVQIELKDLHALKDVAIGNNKLTKVSIINAPNLESLNCMGNQIEKIDLKEFSKLKYFTADNNKLKELDISENPKLIQIIITNNNIKEIDIRNNPKFKVDLMYADDGIKIIRNEDQGNKKAVPPPPGLPPAGN